jgi:hypothetical protein
MIKKHTVNILFQPGYEATQDSLPPSDERGCHAAQQTTYPTQAQYHGSQGQSHQGGEGETCIGICCLTESQPFYQSSVMSHLNRVIMGEKVRHVRYLLPNKEPTLYQSNVMAHLNIVIKGEKVGSPPFSFLVLWLTGSSQGRGQRYSMQQAAHLSHHGSPSRGAIRVRNSVIPVV